jgi:WD40 repeat protein
MAVVFKARQVSLNRICALKMILAGGLAGPDALQRFRIEAEAIARLQHPNIVAVYEVGQHEGLPFISLEFCGGGNLDRKVAGTPVPPRQAAKLVRTLAEAMDAAHQANVIHRDLKPANVMLVNPPEVPLDRCTLKITDFGLAKKLDEAGQTASNAIVGTPSYMAPEQAGSKSKEVGPATDVYALGAILYELLTGRPPFKAATVMDTLMQVVADEPVPPRQLQWRLPRDLETITLKCLHKEPSRRYSSAAALAGDLDRFLAGEPIRARRVSGLERAGKWVRRNPAVAVLTAAVAASLLLGASLAAVLAVRADREAKDAKRLAAEAKENEKAAQAQAHRADMALHRFQVNLALQAWQQNDLIAAEAALDEVPSDFRQAWEYRHLRSLCRRKMMPLWGHVDAVRSVAISADGKRIISGSDDKTVKVQDATSGKELLSLAGHKLSVASVAISADGRRIVSGSHDQTVKVWNARTGRLLMTLDVRHPVRSVAISADGKRIISGGGQEAPGKPVLGELLVWDAITGKALRALEGHRGPVLSVAISADSKRIVSGGRGGIDGQNRQLPGEVKVWDAGTGKSLLSLAGHSLPVTSVAISPDAKRIVSAGQDGMVKVHDAATGEEILSLTGSTVTSVAISPDGRFIASGGADQTVKLQDAATGQTLQTLKGHGSVVNCVAFDPDGKRIVSGGSQGTVKVWDVAAQQYHLTVGEPAQPMQRAAVSSDGKRIVSADGKRAWVQDTATGKMAISLSGLLYPVISVAISPDGKYIVSGGGDIKRPSISAVGKPDPGGAEAGKLKHFGELKVWDAATGRLLFSLVGHAWPVSCLAISADGERIASGSLDQTVKLWDAATGNNLLTLEGHKHLVSCVEISSDGKQIVSGSHDRTVKVWDAQTGKEILSLVGHAYQVKSVAITADGSRIVSSGGEVNKSSELKVWDAVAGKELRSPVGHTLSVSSVTISPDGSRIVTGGWDNTVRVWDAHTGQELISLKGHTAGVRSVTISPDGTRIVSTSADATMKFWDAARGPDRIILKGHGNLISSVAFSPDGKQVFGRESAGKVLAWDVESSKLLPEAPLFIPAGRAVAVYGNRRAIAEGRGIRIEQVNQEEDRRPRLLDAHASREFHSAEAVAAEMRRQPFAAVFHLDRLLLLMPEHRPFLLHRRQTVLAAARKKAPNDAWVARTLARQAIIYPFTPVDRKALLEILARQQDAPVNRVYGGLLLRTGSVREAILVLDAALRNRDPATSPVEELFLALAHAQLNQLAQARRHLQAAVARMPRDASLDPLTAHELTALRAEVERALATRRP